MDKYSIKEVYDSVREGVFERDIVILDDVHEMSFMNTEYHSLYFYIGLCRKGYNAGKYDYKDYRFGEGQMCWVLPDHVLSHSEISDDYTVLSVFFSKKMYRYLNSHHLLGKYLYTTGLATLTLTEDLFNLLYETFLLMKKMVDSDMPGRLEIISSFMNIVVSLVDNYIKQNDMDVAPQQLMHEQLFERFYEAITEHYHESREVNYYASLLCLSPKYFASIIRKVTNIAPTEWINRYVIVEAKWLLLHDRDKTIQQISNNMGFTEQSSFSRFFKQYVGVTPSDFRLKGE